MSEITRGVMGMPYEMTMDSELSRRQFYAIAREVYAENESLRKDAYRYRRLKLDASMDGSLIERLDCNIPVRLWDSAIDSEASK